METTRRAQPLGLMQWLRWAHEVALEPRRLIVEQATAWPASPDADADIEAAVESRGLLTGAEQQVVATLRFVGGLAEREAYAGWDGADRVMVLDARWVTGVHPTYQCQGRGCWVHHASEHAMVNWPVSFCDVHQVAHRVCTHRHLHPDVDDVAYRRLQGDVDAPQHGCRCPERLLAGRWSSTGCPCGCCEESIR